MDIFCPKVGQDGIAPPVFLMWGIYSPLPSLLGILTHKKAGPDGIEPSRRGSKPRALPLR